MRIIKKITLICFMIFISFAAFCDEDESSDVNDVSSDVSADVSADVKRPLNGNILGAMQIIEVIGVAEVRKLGERLPIQKGETIAKGSTLWTGLHSAVSCSIAGDSIITMNQLANLTFLGGQQTKKGLEYQITADSGFIIMNTRPLGEAAAIITLTTPVGTLVCKNLVGQIYIGSDHGILLTVNEGSVKVKPKIKTFYTLRKGGMCAITKDGYLIDNDKLIRGKISAIPSNVIDAESVSLFINRFHDSYTKERYTNDYFDQRHR